MIPVALWTALMACQEPFEHDRHDLRGFRIAAVVAESGTGPVRPRVAMIVEDHPWSSTPVEFAWYRIEAEGDSADLDGGPLATGPAPILPPLERLAVVARFGDQEARAELAVNQRRELDVGLRRESLDLDASLLGATELAVEARQALTPQPYAGVQPDGAVRFTLEGDLPASAVARMMSTAGTIFELDALTADWFAADLALDDEDVVRGDALPDQPVTFIALAIADGASGFTAVDLALDVSTPPTFGGRLLPGAPAGRSWATLTLDDSAPSGLRVDASTPTADRDWDPSSVGCSSVSGSFTPSWLLEQRCDRSQLAGATVLLVADP